jgi:hypothetical protein
MNIPTTNEAGLVRISQAARLAGLTPQVFRAGLVRGDIPIPPIYIGGLTFVRANQFAAWLTSAPAPAAANLFR